MRGLQESEDALLAATVETEEGNLNPSTTSGETAEETEETAEEKEDDAISEETVP